MSKHDLNYQLGIMVGELIVSKYLPTLSTDSLQTNHVIQVDEELTREWEKLHTKWSDSLDKEGKEYSNALFYENLAWYKSNIENKFLKDELEIRVSNFTPTDMEEFKAGVDHSLWNCDCSHYSLSKVKEYMPGAWCRVIILKRD